MKKKLIMLAALMLALLIPFTVFAETLTINTTTLDGKSFSSSEFKNYKLIMVNFWGEWCGPCVGELPELQKIYKENKDLLIVGVWYGNSAEEALSVAKKAGVTYPLVHGDSNLDKIEKKLQYYPTTFFYDANGNMIGEKEGYIGSRDYEGWKSIVDDLMSKVGPTSATVDGLKYDLNSSKKTAEFTKIADKSITELVIPASFEYEGTTYKVTSVAKNACKSNKKITAVTIGKNVKTIGENAFKSCTKLAALTIGKNVKTIGKSAFQGCKKLKKMTIETTKLTTKTVGDKAFADGYKKVTVKCPAKKKAAYKKLLLAKGVKKVTMK